MEWVWLLAILACPVVMGLVMFFMMRGMRGQGGRDDGAAGS
jgi:hypothetical protein